MKRFIIILSLFTTTFSYTQQAPLLETYSLKNGLKVFFLKYGKIEAMNVSVIINSGKKNEIPGQQGYNALTADLVLQGNKKYTKEQQNDIAFKVGAELGSESDFDKTTLSGNFLAKDAETAFDLLSAAIMQPLFEKEKIDYFLSYIINYNNPNKMDVSRLASIYSIYTVHGIDNPLGRSYYKEQLKTITPEKIKEFHQFNYTPKNTRILVCGNFDSEKVKSLIEKYFTSWASTFGEINDVSLEFPTIKKKEVFFANRTGATQCALQWNKTAPSCKDKDGLAFAIALQIYNDYLFKEIREKGGKTYSIGANHTSSRFSTIFSTGCSVRNEELFNTIELFDKTLAAFYSCVFTKDQFENELKKYSTKIMNSEYPEEILSAYHPLNFDFSKRQNVLNDLKLLTMEDVRKVIKKYFNPETYKLVIAGDEKVVADQLEKIKNLQKLSATDISRNSSN